MRLLPTTRRTIVWLGVVLLASLLWTITLYTGFTASSPLSLSFPTCPPPQVELVVVSHNHSSAGEQEVRPVSRNAVVVTSVNPAEMKQLREFVGSIHRLRKDNYDVHRIIVYGFGLGTRDVGEIGTWRNVDYFDAEQEVLFGPMLFENSVPDDASFDWILGQDPSLKEHLVKLKQKLHQYKEEKGQMLKDVQYSHALILNLLDLNMRKYGMVLYARNDIAFTIDSLHAIEDIIEAENLIFVGSDAYMKSDSTQLAPITQAKLIGCKFGSPQANLFISLELQCLRGYHCSRIFRQSLLLHQKKESKSGFMFYDLAKFGVVEVTESTRKENFCFLLLRDDVLYSFDVPNVAGWSVVVGSDNRQHNSNAVVFNSEQNDVSAQMADKRKIMAFGMPTMSVSSLETFTEVSPIRLFLTSFLPSVTAEEWKTYRYVFYIGFDENDRFFDNTDTRKNILKHMVTQSIEFFKANNLEAEMKQMKAYSKKEFGGDLDGEKHDHNDEHHAPIEFRLIRFSVAKGWVAYIWNGLFIQAMREGSHYFFQVNDDVFIRTNGWTSIVVSKLVEMNDQGVVGPSDHGGNLITQAFVGRTHYKIFGRLYPLDIKDWYSDNWLNDVYGSEGRRTLPEVVFYNMNDKGTRYDVCDRPNWQVVLERGKSILRDYNLDMQKEKEIRQALESEGKSASDLDKLSPQQLELIQSRIANELTHGPLLQ